METIIINNTAFYVEICPNGRSRIATFTGGYFSGIGTFELMHDDGAHAVTFSAPSSDKLPKDFQNTAWKLFDRIGKMIRCYSS